MNVINSNNGASYHMRAPLIDKDAGRKVEMFFPTAEVAAATKKDRTGVYSAEIVRDKTVVVLRGILHDDAQLHLSVTGVLNPGAEVVVVFECDDVAHSVDVNDGKAVLAGTAGKFVAVPLTIVDDQFYGPAGGAPVSVNKAVCCEVIEHDVAYQPDLIPIPISIKKERTLVRVLDTKNEELSADREVVLSVGDEIPFVEIVVVFGCGATAYDLNVRIDDQSVVLEGTADTVTTKKLVFDGNHIYVL